MHLEGLGRAPVAVVGFAEVDGADGVPAGLFLPLLASAFTVVVVDQVLDLPELLVVALVVVEDVDFQTGEFLGLLGLLAVAQEDLQLGRAVVVLDHGVFDSLLLEDVGDVGVEGEFVLGLELLHLLVERSEGGVGNGAGGLPAVRIGAVGGLVKTVDVVGENVRDLVGVAGFVVGLEVEDVLLVVVGFLGRDGGQLLGEAVVVLRLVGFLRGGRRVLLVVVLPVGGVVGLPLAAVTVLVLSGHGRSPLPRSGRVGLPLCPFCRLRPDFTNICPNGLSCACGQSFILQGLTFLRGPGRAP